MDDVPLPLRAALSGPPAALAVVERVLELVLRVRETEEAEAGEGARGGH
jgi:hypothetical protein